MINVEQLKAEKAELETRTTKLLAFIESEEFKKLDDVDKRLLRQQYAGMEVYLISLTGRLLKIDANRYNAEMEKYGRMATILKNQGYSDAEITEKLKDKVFSIQPIGAGQLDTITGILLGGMMFSTMQKPNSRKK